MDDSLLSIHQSTAQALIDYLKKRPYEEVYQLIAALLQLRKEEKEDGRRIHHDPE
jgi:hypothetical protein